MTPILRIEAPKRFGMAAVCEINILAAISAGIIAFFSLGGLLLCFGFVGLGLSMDKWFLVPLGLLCGCIGGFFFSFLPLIQINPFVRHIVRENAGPVSDRRDTHDVQLAITPRLCKGLRGFLEDADDIGRLTIFQEGIRFEGDHVYIELPFSAIDELTHVNSGARLIWLVGRRVRTETTVFEGVQRLEFLERESNTIMTSRRISGNMVRTMEAGIQRSRGV